MKYFLFSLLVSVQSFALLVSSDNPGCPCLSSTGSALDPYKDGGILYFEGVAYPSDYGEGCGQHDLNLAPYCNNDDDASNPEFCTEQFCYVNKNNCNLPLVYLSGYFPDSGLYYSFQTCGSNGTFYDWYNGGSGDDDTAPPLDDLVDLVENYVLTIRNSLQADFSEFLSVNSPCEYESSCSCTDCTYNSNWDESVAFTTTVVLDPPDITDTSTCISASARSYFTKVASAEYQDSANVGGLYAGMQDDGTFTQWPAIDWCPTDYDPRFRPWYSTAVTPPKLLVLVIDISGSMGGTRIHLAAEAAKATLLTLSWKDRVGFVLFNEVVAYTRYPAYVTDAERTSIENWIDTYVSAGGGTTFYEPLIEAINMIDNDPGCSNAILFLTDGEASFTVNNYDTVDALTDTNDIVIFTYALGSGADGTVMKQIACENGGIYYAVSDSADLGEVMSSYYAYYAASTSNAGVRWINYEDFATGTELLAACSPLYDNTDPSSEVSVIFGAICMDVNVIASVDTLRGHIGWSDFYSRVEDETSACLAQWSGYGPSALFSALEYVRYSEQDNGAETCEAYNDDNDVDDDDSGGGSSSVGGIVAGIVIPLICIGACIAFLVKRRSLQNQIYPGAMTGTTNSQPTGRVVQSQHPQPMVMTQPMSMQQHFQPQPMQQHFQPQPMQQPQPYIQMIQPPQQQQQPPPIVQQLQQQPLQQRPSPQNYSMPAGAPQDTNNAGLYVAQ